MILKIFTDLSIRIGDSDADLNPIVWAQIDDIPKRDKIEKHHSRFTNFEMTSSMDKADIFVLPNNWKTYVDNNAIELAVKFAKIAEQKKKYVLVWSGGDPEWIIPITNAILIQEGLHKGIERAHSYAFERPAFAIDYVQKFFPDSWLPIKKEKLPTIGFCGMGESRLLSKISYFIRNNITKIKFSLSISDHLPIMHSYPIYLRKKMLNILQDETMIKTDFVIREQFLAGIKSREHNEKLEHSTRTEFINNIYNNMYTICVRGGGNFSRRFYETLCLGRIPILLDTNCVLPFEEFIDWNKHILKVKMEDIDLVKEIVFSFHQSHTNQELINIQNANRKLWKEYLSVKGYYSNFHLYESYIKNFN